MMQVTAVGDLNQSVGYGLKKAASALRASMDVGLRPIGLTVSQYACLELLGARPGQSNADLARGAFVTRQSMNEVLRGLQDRGLVTRPDIATAGRSRPTRLTANGQDALREASEIVSRIEQQMLSPLSADEEEQLLRALAACTVALSESAKSKDEPDVTLSSPA